jgi:hypothetical protein
MDARVGSAPPGVAEAGSADGTDVAVDAQAARKTADRLK